MTSHYAITQAIANWLTGALQGYDKGLMTYSTRISQTALMGVFETTDGDSSYGYLAKSLISDDLKKLTRNLTVDKLVEELSRNLTLSLFSAEILRYVLHVSFSLISFQD